MPKLKLNKVHIAYEDSGDGAPVVFGNSLGTDMRLWDPILPHLPDGLRIVRYDMRGHGASDCPPGPYSMGMLVRDAEALLDALNIRNCVFVGLSLGGMVAQGLAVKRFDQVRAMVLSNTAAKIGTAEIWQERAELVEREGLESLLDVTMERWFTKAFRASPEIGFWRDMVAGQRPEGYAACCRAIGGTDFYTPTAGLTLPTLGIAASHDGSTPADLVRETTDLVKGSRFELIRNAGHIPCVEQPTDYAARLTKFLQSIGHLHP